LVLSCAVVAAALFAAWVLWAVKDGAELMSQGSFGVALDRLGLPASPPIHGKRWRRGVVVMDDPDAPEKTDREWSR